MMTAQERLAELKELREEYKNALKAALLSKSYKVGDMELERPDVSDLQEKLNDIEAQIAKVDALASGRGRSRVRAVIPVDGLGLYRRRVVR